MRIVFLPGGEAVETDGSENLLQLARRAKVALDSSCGGAGVCGKCKVNITSGDRMTTLACLHHPKGDMTVELPQYAGAYKRKADMTAADRRFDADNEHAGRFRQGERFGLAFDVGTTTVVGILMDLVTGERVGAVAEANPQAAHGADVISRIMFAEKSSGNLMLMRDEISSCMNSIAGRLAEAGSLSKEAIWDVVIVGNTTMSHLIAGVDPGSLARAPFEPAFYDLPPGKAHEFGIEVNRGARAGLLPNIAGHVGSDITAGIIASGILEKGGARVLIDVGTNGEIVACAGGKALACSTAAGPAFEGASIRHGMRAAAGAIEGVELLAHDLTVSTIDGAQSVGICGSGIIDAAACLVKAGLVEKSGRLITQEKALERGVSEDIASRLREGEGGRELVLDREGGIVMTQKDIREVQLAKAAMRAGVRILLGELGACEEELDAVYIAGAFGNHISTESAVEIGLIPDVARDRISCIGNAAGIGACMALLSDKARMGTARAAKEVGHVDLASNPRFQEVYLGEMSFGRVLA